MALESVKRAAAATMSSQATRGTSQNNNTRKVEQRQNVTSIADYADAPATVNGGLAAKNEDASEESEKEAENRIKSAINHANHQIRHSGKTNCEFSYNEEIRRISITVFDSETKEVIREIPAEETLEMVEKMYELAGILVDVKQ